MANGGAGDNWELGTPVNGPAAAFSGTNVYATSLTGNIEPFSDCYLRSPAINLTGASRATLTFQEWRSVDPDPTFHGTIVNVLDPNSLAVLQQLSTASGATTGYQSRTVTLPPQLNPKAQSKQPAAQNRWLIGTSHCSATARRSAYA